MPVAHAAPKFWTATDGARRLAKTAAAKRHRHLRLRVPGPAAIDAHTPSNTCALHRAIMRPTATCLAPGFMKRSLDEFKRLSLFGERRLHPRSLRSQG
jgi:hypothetical protein